jgi:hypothetical protein
MPRDPVRLQEGVTMTQGRGFRLAAWLYVGFWVVGAVLMVVVYNLYPPDPTLVGTASYGHSRPEEVGVLAVMVTLEFVLFGALLQPWSYDRSWGRCLVSLFFLAPWFVLCAAMGMHAGPTTMLHLGWLALFGLGLIVFFLAAVIGRVRG